MPDLKRIALDVAAAFHGGFVGAVESPPSIGVAYALETASAGSGNGEGEKKTSVPSEQHPAWDGLNRAHFLQAEQVRSYRAKRDADLDELEDA